MPICKPNELINLISSSQRLLGLDLGSKTIGISLSDSQHVVASPITTIKRSKFRSDANIIIQLILENDIGGLVIGLPKNMDGTEGPRCQSTRQFAKSFLEIHELPITFWDERLTTAEVERILIQEADMSRKRRGKIIDKMAAGVILQSFLNYHKSYSIL
ncbi:MAG: putative pre-16S rRNA nuclease [Alphaproteobacteria bacterium MarineAlpha12_Bin1]|jgi:putative Holliday junction resolvase|nr:MAG: putative pre-16S rRNA nuclease [Alphaproteobacteria bacterium MarineAlpha12_Bin1]|tara:strand:+ start:1557 stop:2033 length:477 start_codon:yes stop_codon:yes gene_type:complete